MSGRKSRDKGVRGELEWSRYLKSFGVSARRGRQFSGSPESPDVKSALDSDFACEVKRVERLSIYPAMAQAVEDAGGAIPYVAHRRNHKDWLVTFRAEDAVPMMQLWKQVQDG